MPVKGPVQVIPWLEQAGLSSQATKLCDSSAGRMNSPRWCLTVHDRIIKSCCTYRQRNATGPTLLQITSRLVKPISSKGFNWISYF